MIHTCVAANMGLMNSGAGIIRNTEQTSSKCVQSRVGKTDMQKVDVGHGSLSFTFNQTPTVVGGRLHQIGNILGMISQWEDMECKEEEEGRVMEKGGVRSKRTSQRISER